MHRTLLALALVLPLGCNKNSSTATKDPKFDSHWSELTKKGTPAYIESGENGAGLMGEVRRAVESAPESGKVLSGAVLPGELPDFDAEKIVRSNLVGVRACYQVEERAGRVGSGKAIMSLDIEPSGTVAGVKIDAPAFQQSNLPNCLSTRAKSWAFPKFTGSTKHFSYPLVFVGG